MKHLIKCTLFVEVDMDHPTYPADGTRDIDQYVETRRADFAKEFNDREGAIVEGALFTGCQVELVE